MNKLSKKQAKQYREANQRLAANNIAIVGYELTGGSHIKVWLRNEGTGKKRFVITGSTPGCSGQMKKHVGDIMREARNLA